VRGIFEVEGERGFAAVFARESIEPGGTVPMNIAITFRQMEATEAVKVYATDKVGKLQKFLRQPMKGEVKLSCQHRLHTAEVDVHAGGEHFHAHETSEDMYATLDKVVDKIESQIRNVNGVKVASKKGAERASAHLADDGGEES
jgi:putative sigma-54 modulation protein